MAVPRSLLLAQIATVIAAKCSVPKKQYYSVADLRADFPALPVKALHIEGLLRLKKKIAQASGHEIDSWRVKRVRGRTPPLSQEQILSLRERGMSLRAIAQTCGVSYETIRRRLQ